MISIKRSQRLILKGLKNKTFRQPLLQPFLDPVECIFWTIKFTEMEREDPVNNSHTNLPGILKPIML